jgi:hypothetical protein
VSCKRIFIPSSVIWYFCPLSSRLFESVKLSDMVSTTRIKAEQSSPHVAITTTSGTSTTTAPCAAPAPLLIQTCRSKSRPTSAAPPPSSVPATSMAPPTAIPTPLVKPETSPMAPVHLHPKRAEDVAASPISSIASPHVPGAAHHRGRRPSRIILFRRRSFAHGSALGSPSWKSPAGPGYTSMPSAPCSDTTFNPLSLPIIRRRSLVELSPDRESRASTGSGSSQQSSLKEITTTAIEIDRYAMLNSSVKELIALACKKRQWTLEVLQSMGALMQKFGLPGTASPEIHPESPVPFSNKKRPAYESQNTLVASTEAKRCRSV